VRRRLGLLKAKKEENRVTRTTNQLHFEDLDPIRFEELILAMAYKWRRWESINHFGKLGSDDGIDIEATENIVWDKSILETMLYTDYQNLLFAYFGINLIKEYNNKIKTIRRNIALKKRMHLDFLNNNSIGNYSVTEQLKKPFLKFGFTKMIIHSIYDKIILMKIPC